MLSLNGIVGVDFGFVLASSSVALKAPSSPFNSKMRLVMQKTRKVCGSFLAIIRQLMRELCILMSELIRDIRQLAKTNPKLICQHLAVLLMMLGTMIWLIGTINQLPKPKAVDPIKKYQEENRIQNDHDILQDQIKNKEGLLGKLEKTLTELGIKHRIKRKKHTKAKKEYKVLEKKHKKRKRDYKNELDKLILKNGNKIKKVNNTKKSEIKELEKKMKKLTKKNKKLKKKVEKLGDKKSEYKQKYKDQNGEVKTLNKKKEKYKKKYNDLKEKLKN